MNVNGFTTASRLTIWNWTQQQISLTNFKSHLRLRCYLIVRQCIFTQKYFNLKMVSQNNKRNLRWRTHSKQICEDVFMFLFLFILNFSRNTRLQNGVKRYTCIERLKNNRTFSHWWNSMFEALLQAMPASQTLPLLFFAVYSLIFSTNVLCQTLYSVFFETISTNSQSSESWSKQSNNFNGICSFFSRVNLTSCSLKQFCMIIWRWVQWGNIDYTDLTVAAR